MFTEWGFLLTEIWVLLGLAALVGLLAGWLIWGGRVDVGSDADEVRRLRRVLDRAKAQSRAALADPQGGLPAMDGGRTQRTGPPALEPQPAADPKPRYPAPDHKPPEHKPKALDRARDGLPDDLTKIKGIGPKLEKLCNALGVWHYDQIAAWTTQEVAWMDNNLEGFKGRVTRDNWVDQATALAVNDTPAFVRRRD